MDGRVTGSRDGRLHGKNAVGPHGALQGHGVDVAGDPNLAAVLAADGGAPLLGLVARRHHDLMRIHLHRHLFRPVVVHVEQHLRGQPTTDRAHRCLAW